MRADLVLVQCCSPDQRGRSHRNSNRTANIAQHIPQAGGGAHILVRNGGHHHGGHGHKDKAQREASQRNGNQQRIRANIEIDAAEDHGADGKSQKTCAKQLAIVDARAKEADNG